VGAGAGGAGAGSAAETVGGGSATTAGPAERWAKNHAIAAPPTSKAPTTATIVINED
jgi:hypothetical protein